MPYYPPASAGSGENVSTSTIWDTKGDLIAATGSDTGAKIAVGSDGGILSPDTAVSTGIKWAENFFQVPATSSYLVTQFALGGINTSSVPTLSTLYFTPVWVPKNQTFDRISFYLQTVGSAGAVARLGIYTSTTGGAPGTLVLDAGTVATDSGTGSKEITISQALTPGLHFMAYVSQTATCTPRTMTRCGGFGGSITFAIGSFLEVVANINTNSYQRASVTGALPTPAAATAIGNALTGVSIGLRAT